MLILAEYCKRLGIDFENLTFEQQNELIIKLIQN
jgi:hypothetical protein